MNWMGGGGRPTTEIGLKRRVKFKYFWLSNVEQKVVPEGWGRIRPGQVTDRVVEFKVDWWVPVRRVACKSKIGTYSERAHVQGDGSKAQERLGRLCTSRSLVIVAPPRPKVSYWSDCFDKNEYKTLSSAAAISPGLLLSCSIQHQAWRTSKHHRADATTWSPWPNVTTHSPHPTLLTAVILYLHR